LTLDTFNEVLLGGVVLGSLYALMATGLALVWTTLGIFNFAHGTFIALGAYFAWQIASSDAMGAGLLVGALTSIVGMFVVGVLAYYLLIKPFERSPDIVVKSVITTLAGATILENSINLVWGPRNKQLDAFLSGDISFLAWSCPVTRRPSSSFRSSYWRGSGCFCSVRRLVGRCAPLLKIVRRRS
jgi:branched-chain amino acid transport system permease protein